MLLALLAGFYSLVTPPAYRAGTHIVLTLNGSGLGATIPALSALLPELSTDGFVINTEVETLKSPDLLRALIEDQALVSDREFNPLPWPSRFITWLNQSGLTSAVPNGTARANPDTPDDQIVEDILNRLQKAVTIINVPNSLVIVIDMQSHHPEKAARLANALAELYINRQKQHQLRQHQATVDWAKSQVARLQTNAEASEKALYDFLVHNNVLSVSDVHALQNKVQTPGPGADKARQNLQSALHTAINKQSTLYSTVTRLQQNAQINRALYLSVLTEFKELVLYQGQTQATARILSYAHPPVEKSTPDGITLALLVGTLGTVLAGVWILYQTAGEFYVKSPAVAAGLLGCPIVGHWYRPRHKPRFAKALLQRKNPEVIALTPVLAEYENSPLPRALAIGFAQALQKKGYSVVVVDTVQTTGNGRQHPPDNPTAHAPKQPDMISIPGAGTGGGAPSAAHILQKAQQDYQKVIVITPALHTLHTPPYGKDSSLDAPRVAGTVYRMCVVIADCLPKTLLKTPGSTGVAFHGMLFVRSSVK